MEFQILMSVLMELSYAVICVTIRTDPSLAHVLEGTPCPVMTEHAYVSIMSNTLIIIAC